MWPGSAVEGRRIQGSYCTLWNGLRNARCLPYFRFGLCHMLEATGFEDNVTLLCMCGTALAHGCLRSPTSTFPSDSLKASQTGMQPPAAAIQPMDAHVWP